MSLTRHLLQGQAPLPPCERSRRSRVRRTAAAALVFLAGYRSRADTPADGSADAGSASVPSAQVPERRPSTGLAWSKTHYPDQFAPAHWVSVELEGLDDQANERFIDAAGSAYSATFVSGFSYTDPDLSRPSVTLEYLRRAEAFIGRLTARGLKPNFAYQLKLRGIREERESFRRIGSLGRWRQAGRVNVYPDPDADELGEALELESYLFFDFMLTDSQGNAVKEFYADSSLHVLTASPQTGPGGWHTRPVPLDRSGSNPAIYVRPLAESPVVEVFAESEAAPRAESEPHRPRVGEAYLPAGSYVTELVLTEGSFHWYGDGGNWATVMRAPVEFEVVERPRPSPYWQQSVAVVRPLSLAKAYVQGIGASRKDADTLEGLAQDDDPTVVFAETIRFPEAGRYCLGLELRVTAEHCWRVAVYDADSLGAVGSYTIAATGYEGWRRFEVELTSMVLGQRIRLRIDPSMAAGPIGLRNVGFRRIPAQ